MMNDLLDRHRLLLQQQGLYRQRIVEKEFADCINFSSNDYLSLKDDVRIKAAFERGFVQFPAGSGASMSVCGYHGIHQELEQTFASLLGVEDALLFGSGYTANLALTGLVAHLGAHLLIDKSVHASVYDGIMLANAGHSRFLHDNLGDLERKIPRYAGKQVLFTEGIFSMSGQQPDLAALADLCEQHHTAIIVDEAHSFGVIGKEGLGAVNHYGLSQASVPLRMITFGKAMGSQGAVVAGQAGWIDGLFQIARSHRYTTGMSPALAYGVLESIPLVQRADDRRAKLFQLVGSFQQMLGKSPLNWRKSATPIQQLQLGCPGRALDYSHILKQKGLFCQPMRAPTVSPHDTGLRIVLNAHHEQGDLDKLFHHLESIHDSGH